MSGLLDKVKYIVGLDDEEEVEYEYEEEQYETLESAPKQTETKNNKVVSIHTHTNANTKVMIYEPKAYNEVTTIIEELKNRKLIVINMLGLEGEVKGNVFHCLSGAIYAMEGNMQKVAKDIFVLAPNNVEVDSNKISEEMSNKGIFPWQK
ncbi:cell division protein SepF [Andreesenia angusta]|uniref:Cell division protein SepF n=1 Tax=Andreesenia angusta TaxID=39480 RepID=A0A1S1V7N9_9FIRM|nr:cell division protein SepF [Andreesenia angusta]OHW62623.1 cell division protein SepF [Andreesenia angusta]